MEGIQTINALKAVVSSLPAQTTIPSSELVMLYAADGTPIAKIARDDLVKAVASVMASNSQNTFSKLLGVQANGTPMGIGASDLASVLGVVKWKGFLYGINTAVDTGISVNASVAGECLLALCSGHNNSGDATISAIYMLRFGYDGGFIQVTEIAKSSSSAASGSFTFAVSGNNTLTIAGPHGTNYAKIISNKD